MPIRLQQHTKLVHSLILLRPSKVDFRIKNKPLIAGKPTPKALMPLMSILALGFMSFFFAGCQSQYKPRLPIPSVRQVQVNSQGSTLPEQTWPSATGNVSHPEWLPLAGQEQKKKWKGILIHHSGTDAGDAIAFDKHHKEANGWDELGYHFVISNGNNAHNIRDGIVEVGRRWKVQKYGAHCRVDPSDDNYWNEHTIGICLVGNLQEHPPTATQYVSLIQLVKFLQNQYNISTPKILGHSDVYGTRTKCPGKYFSMSKLKGNLNG